MSQPQTFEISDKPPSPAADPIGWDAFLQKVIAHFREEPGPRIRAKLEACHRLGVVTPELLNILARTRGLTELACEPVDWWGEGYRPQFRSDAGHPFDHFLPRTIRQLVRDPRRLASRVRAFLAYYLGSLHFEFGWADCDVMADVRRFVRFLAWAERQADPVAALFLYKHDDPGFVCAPAWPRLYWIRRTVPRQALGPHTDRLKMLQDVTRFELAGRPAGLGSDLLMFLGLPPPSPDEAAEIRRMCDEILWAKAAIRHLDSIREASAGAQESESHTPAGWEARDTRSGEETNEERG